MRTFGTFYPTKQKLMLRSLFLISFLFSGLLTSCLPTEQSIDQSSLLDLVRAPASAKSGTFVGLTGVQTDSDSKLTLRWTASSESGVVAYNIYDTSLMFSPRLIKTVSGASTNSTSITSLNAQQYYSFRVRSVKLDKDGVTPIEDTNTKDMGGIPYAGIISNNVTSSTTADVTYSSGSDSDSIRIYCLVGLTAVTETLIKTVTDTRATTTTLTGLVAGETYTCRSVLEVGGFEDNNRITTTFIPLGEATQLTFNTQPSSNAAGVIFNSQPVIAIKDINGNTITAGPDASAQITLTIATSSPTLGTLRGTATVTAVRGIASFSGLNIQEAGIKILTASKSDTSSTINGSGILTANSNQFTISPGAVDATNSTITISPAVPPNPALTADGNASYTVTITLKDQYSNPISGIKPQIGSNIAGDTIIQPQLNTDATGQSSGNISTIIADETSPFRNLSISSPSGLSAVTVRTPFVAGAPNKLGFSVQPTNSPAGANGLSTIKVTVQDSNGNPILSGPSSTSAVTLTIASNTTGASLTGTTTINAINGVATFTGLGIDRTGTGYKLLASSGSLTPAYSNSFNVTAGVPQKIVISGTQSVLSGACSSAITIQLQDGGNNATTALQNTPTTISGLSGASLYTSASCSGTAISSTLTFTAGTHTKTLYLKNQKSEVINLVVSDTSNVLTAGSRSIAINPSKIKLTAHMPSPPAAANTEITIAAGACSPALQIIPMGEDLNPGPISTSVPVTITGIAGTQAKLYSDSACTTEVNPTSVSLPITAGGPSSSFKINIYLKDPKSEVLSLNVADGSAIMSTTSLPQPVNISASDIDFTGPNTVVAGQCSSVYTITLKDKQNNSVVANANTSLTINGLAGTSTGRFYTNSSCTGTAYSTSLTLPQGASSLAVYFKDSTAETLNVSISDPANLMTTSQVITIGISPAAYRITGPSPARSKTTVCAGPFTVNTMDGAATPNVTAAITPLQANLTHSNYAADYTDAAKFYSDASCDNTITSVNFSAGESSKSFYLQSEYPITNLELRASDPAGILATGTMAWQITADKGWLGTLGKMFDNLGNLIWFRMNTQPVASRYNGPTMPRGLAFDPTKRWLYVVDSARGRIHKYDYLNQRYVGWIGVLNNNLNATQPISGSNQALYPEVPSPASCVSKTHWQTTPGWCIGGESSNASDRTTIGGFYNPQNIVDDGTYIYVTHWDGHVVTRYESSSGSFAGWIGNISGTPTGNAVGGPSSCSSTSSGMTPGWCIGGTATSSTNGSGWGTGGEGFKNPRSLAVDDTYLYIGQYGSIQRFNKSTGSFSGWIGMAHVTPPTGGAAGCSSLSSGTTTPGWCLGGTYSIRSDQSSLRAGGFNLVRSIQVDNGILYSLDTYGGVINKYDTNTGSYLGHLSNLAFNWIDPQVFTYDSTTSMFYVGDLRRVIAVDSTGLLVGWIGKVSNNAGLSKALQNTIECSTLQPNANTPGWCLGGSAKAGLDDTSFETTIGMAIDSQGKLIVSDHEAATIKKFNKETGAYEGSLVASSSAPTKWSNDATSNSEIYGFGDGDFFTPMGVHSDGSYLYIADARNGRVKKIKSSTGELVGWIGGVTTVPTGGVTPNCLSMNPMSVTPGWCYGALPNSWDGTGTNFLGSTSINGLFYYPSGITGDGTHIYVTDAYLHRISKIVASTGVFVGWVGNIATSPTGGSSGCSGKAIGTPTPGWCTGGGSQEGSSDGMLRSPTGITYVPSTGYLYVVDGNNHRVSAWNASTGEFKGWIGRIGSAPSSGCATGSNGSYTVSTSGWCFGGASSATSSNGGGGDRGGGFYFDGSNFGGISTDGSSIYIANFWNRRIDKYSTGGVWLGAVRPSRRTYTLVWSNDPDTVSSWTQGCDYPRGIWTDGTRMYGVNYQDCDTGWGGTTAIWKMDLSSGNVLGWQGAINPGYSPIDGESGCAGATGTTPGWCQGGRPFIQYRLGQFSEARGVTGDNHFVYIIDSNSNKLTRLPK